MGEVPGRRQTCGKQQQAFRKAIERFFGVFFRKYCMLSNPCSLWYTDDMANIMEACVIIHNMTMLERKEQYTGTRQVRVETDAAESEGARATTYHALELPIDNFQRVDRRYEIPGQVGRRKHYAHLKHSSVEHMHSRTGILLSTRAVGMSLSRSDRVHGPCDCRIRYMFLFLSPGVAPAQQGHRHIASLPPSRTDSTSMLQPINCPSLRATARSRPRRASPSRAWPLHHVHGPSRTPPLAHLLPNHG